MADNKINVTVSANTRKNITVTSSQVSTEITASTDTGRFWAQTSKNWAVSDNIVDNTDYSSKYYANKAKESASSSQSSADVCNNIYNSVQEVSQNIFDNIGTKSEEAVTNIDNAKTEAVDSINSTKSTAISDIEFVADGEKQEIQGLVVDEKEEIKDLANLIKENAQDIASRTSFAMFDTVLKDHVLTYEESKGLALQGTYVYKEAVAGSRYGYPDFYNKCLEEYQNESNIPFGIPWTQPTLTANGTMGGNSFAVEASSQYDDTVPAWKAFDGTGTSDWVATLGVIPSWITFYNPVALNVTKLAILNRTTDNDGVITAGEIQVSNNNSDWVTIKTFSNSVVGNTTAWEIDLSNNTEFYKYYRINGTSFARNYISIGEVTIQATSKVGVKNPNGHIFYDISQKDIVDEIFASTGMAWMYGIDQENERVFLPRNVWFEQMSMNDVGKAIQAGLPNHKHHEFSDQNNGASSDNKYTQQLESGMQVTSMWYSGYAAYVLARTNSPANVGLSSNPIDQTIYGNSDTVQPNAVKKLLYICVGNTEATSTVTDVVEVTTTENDTIPLGYSVYQANGQPSVSWLKSEGQWNDGNVYTTFYNEFVQKIGQAFASGSVVEYTSEYTDYDLVINQDDMTFRLPLLDGSEDLPDWKQTQHLDVVFKSRNYTVPKVGYYTLYLSKDTASAGAFVTVNGRQILEVSITAAWQTINQTVLLQKGDVIACSGSVYNAIVQNYIPLVGNGSLYFKVANAVQNLELLNAGEVLEAVADLIPNNKEMIMGYVTPDRVNAITYTITQGATINFPDNGWIILSVSGNATFSMDVKGAVSSYANCLYRWGRASEPYRMPWFPVAKGEYSIFEATSVDCIYFVPMKGAN